MHVNTIDEKTFFEYLRNPAYFSTYLSLDGYVVNANGYRSYYRFVRVRLADGFADGEHHVEALFGQSYPTYNSSMSDRHFDRTQNLEFMAYIVDYEKTYCETYTFQTLFAPDLTKTVSHFVTNDMAKALQNYMESTTPITAEDYNDKTLQAIAYEKAKEEYVFNNASEKAVDSFCEFLKAIDDTATVEYLANPSSWAKRVVEILDSSDKEHPFSTGKGKHCIVLQHLVAQYCKQFNDNPHCWEHVYKELFDAIRERKNVRIVIEAGGKSMQALYPVANIILFSTVKENAISTIYIAPRKLADDVDKFLCDNYHGHRFRGDIPIATISRIESGKKVLWENPLLMAR